MGGGWEWGVGGGWGGTDAPNRLFVKGVGLCLSLVIISGPGEVTSFWSIVVKVGFASVSLWKSGVCFSIVVKVWGLLKFRCLCCPLLLSLTLCIFVSDRDTRWTLSNQTSRHFGFSKATVLPFRTGIFLRLKSLFSVKAVCYSWRSSDVSRRSDHLCPNALLQDLWQWSYPT